MKAIFFDANPVKWTICQLLRHVWQGCLVSSLSCLRMSHTPPPALPGDDWVRVRTLLGGICGTDIGIVALKQPPDSILQGFSSMPLMFGHENVAVVQEVGPTVDRSWIGRRVCVEPTLNCSVRGINPPCGCCQAGQYGACENFGDDCNGSAKLPAGTSIGYNNRTGGSYGQQFVAHVSQLVPVPDSIDDAQAVLTDPAACSMHAILRTRFRDAGQILIYGAGVLGLAAIACLRAIGYSGRIDILGRGGDPVRSLALKYRADNFVRLPSDIGGRFDAIAKLTGGSVKRVRFGNRMLVGGYDIVFDCVGSPRSTQESVKWTRSRGQVVMLGTSSGGRIDLTPVWFRELDILGAYGRQIEEFEGRRIGTYQLVHELMAAGKMDLSGMLTHTFGIDDYRKAFMMAMNKGRSGAIKVAFDFRQES